MLSGATSLSCSHGCADRAGPAHGQRPEAEGHLPAAPPAHPALPLRSLLELLSSSPCKHFSGLLLHCCQKHVDNVLWLTR